MPNAINTADAVASNPSPVKVFGNPDGWQLVVKASAKTWMKSTKVCDLEHGCLVQTETELRANDGRPCACSQSTVYLPGVSADDFIRKFR